MPARDSFIRQSAVPLILTAGATALTLLTAGGAIPGVLGFGLGAAANTGSGLFSGLVGARWEEKEKQRQLLAAALQNEHLVRLTGDVLAALTSQFADSPAGQPHARLYQKLAAALPATWHTLCLADSAALHALREQDFAATLTQYYGDPATRPALPVATVRAVLAAAATRPAALAALDLTPLAQHIAAHLSPSLATALTSDHASRARREISLRLQAAVITGIRTLTTDFDAAFKAHTKKTRGLATALTNLQKQLAAARKDLKATKKSAGQAAARSKAAAKASLRAARDTRDIKKSTARTDSERRLETYRRTLREGFRGYNELGMEDHVHAEDESPAIWDIYVPPAVTRDAPLTPLEMEKLQGATPPTLPDNMEELLPLLARPEQRRTVILADPGMGKSLLIQRLTAGLAEGRTIASAPALSSLLPIPVILRDIVPHLPPDLSEWTWDTLCETMRATYARSADHLLFASWHDLASLRSELLANENAFFLVDGLDEIGDPARRRTIRNAIWDGFRALPDAKWLVTSRIIGYNVAEVDTFPLYVEIRHPEDPDKQIPGRYLAEFRQSWPAIPPVVRSTEMTMPYNTTADFTIVFELATRLYLAPFDNTRQNKFATNWFKERQTPDPPPGLMHEIRSHPHEGLRVLARTPNLLSYIAILKREGRPLPDGRADLYTAIVRAYLHSIDRAYKLSKDHGATCPIPFAGRVRLLSILGAHMQKLRSAADIKARQNDSTKRRSKNAPESAPDGNILIPESALRALLLPELPRHLPGCDAAKELTVFLSFLSSRSGLLLPRGAADSDGELYAFTHLSFLEYFAAVYLKEELAHHRNFELARRTAEDKRRPFDPAAWLARYPSGPVPSDPTMLPDLAARPEWHEVLFFLAELHHGDDFARDELLENLFPALHSTEEIPMREKKHIIPHPLLSQEAVALALTLARDAHLRLPEPLLRTWCQRLWDAGLAQRYKLNEVKFVNHLSQLLGTHGLAGLAVIVIQEAIRSNAPWYLRHRNTRELVLDDCSGLTDISFVITGWPMLETLSLVSCSSLQSLPELPAELVSLNLQDCTALVSLSDLPPKLVSIHARGCTALQSLLRLPIGLRSLGLAECRALQSLPPLSEGLTELYLTNCVTLKTLPPLPASLSALILNGCTGLQSLPPLPSGLKWLFLQNTGDLADRMRERLKKALSLECMIKT